jgi:ABC-type multidrug transport system fused ATPase/permease subunit
MVGSTLELKFKKEGYSNILTKTSSELDLKNDKTILIVAHRLTTVKNCDIIYKLENRCIIEKGIPEKIIDFNLIK